MSAPRTRSVAARLWVIFFVNGAVLSSWAPRIPEVKSLLGLSDSELGIALFGVAAGSVPALMLGARLLAQVRSGPACVVTAVLFSAPLPVIGLAAGMWQLTAGLAMFVSRSCGDVVLERLSETRVLTGAAVAGLCLIMIGTLLKDPVAALGVIGAAGLLVGPVFPIAVSRAARSAPERAATMTARVSAVGYLAYLGGPPLIGILADGIGLPLAFIIIGMLCCLGIALARHSPACHS